MMLPMVTGIRFLATNPLQVRFVRSSRDWAANPGTPLSISPKQVALFLLMIMTGRGGYPLLK
jgi:hypothetical protein